MWLNFSLKNALAAPLSCHARAARVRADVRPHVRTHACRGACDLVIVLVIHRMVRNLTYIVSPTWSRARTDREVSVGGRVGGLSMCVARRAASLAAAQALHNARRSLSCCGCSLMLRLVHATGFDLWRSCGPFVWHRRGVCAHDLHHLEPHGAESCYLSRCGSAAAQASWVLVREDVIPGPGP